jgi:hypothetical protein
MRQLRTNLFNGLALAPSKHHEPFLSRKVPVSLGDFERYVIGVLLNLSIHEQRVAGVDFEKDSSAVRQVFAGELENGHNNA